MVLTCKSLLLGVALSYDWTPNYSGTGVGMARRRVFPSPETRAAQKLYELLIVTGVGIAFLGMATTCYLAMSEAATAPFDAWISGQTFF